MMPINRLQNRHDYTGAKPNKFNTAAKQVIEFPSVGTYTIQWPHEDMPATIVVVDMHGFIDVMHDDAPQLVAGRELVKAATDSNVYTRTFSSFAVYLS
jgi:hypothetical protein